MKMARLYLILAAMLVTVGSLACTSKQPGVESGVQNGNDNASLQANTQPGGIAGAKVAGGRIFRGSIGDKRIQMTLTREGASITGTYFYQKIGSDISLKGQIKGDEFTLQESDNSGKQTGQFKGKWNEAANLPGAELEGEWSKPNSKDTLVFYATEQHVELTNGLRVVPKEINEENKKSKYSIHVEYPELTGAAIPNADKFNQEVKKLVESEVSDFKKGQQEMSAEDTPPASDMGSDLSMNYDVTLATDNLISILFSASSYEAGAAHPSNYSRVISYDLKSGKVLKLADLFKPGSKYLDAISRYAIGDLKKQKAGQESLDSEWLEKGAAPEADNYQSWNITKKGVAVTFDQYQVASYAEGPQHVVVPFSVLNDVISSDGVLGSIMK